MALSAAEVVHNLALGRIGEYGVEDTTASRALKQNLLCIRYYDQALYITLRAHPWNEAKKRVIIAQDSDDAVFGYDRQYTPPTDCLRVLSVNDITGADPRNRSAGIYAWEVEDAKILANAGEAPQTWATDTKYVDGEFVSATAVVWATGTAYIADQFVKTGGLVYLVLNDHTSTTIAADITAADLQAGVQGSTGTYEVVDSHISDTLLADVASSDIEAVGSESRVIYVEYIYELTTTSLWSSNLTEAVATQLAIKIEPGITGNPEANTKLINEFERLTMPKARSMDGAEGKPKPIFNSQWKRARSSGTFGSRI